MARLTRRIFLRGLGGACVAAPYLGSVVDRAAKADTPASSKRLIVMFTHYGCVTTRFFPRKSHGPLSAEDLAATSLRPLSAFADKLLIPRGIRAMNEWTSTLLRGQGNDPHAQVCGSYFTCHPVTPNSDDPLGGPTGTLFQPKPTGRSLDHVIAEQLSPGGLPLFLRAGNFSDNHQSYISYNAPETAYPGFGSPTQIYATLTGLHPELGPVNPDSYAAAKGRSILDLVRDDLDTLERFDMSQSDRNKLEAWKALLDETGGVLTSSACSPEGAAALGITQENLDAASSRGASTDLTTQIADGLELADIYSNLAVLAAACNANPVIVLKYPPNYVFRRLNLTTESHGLSHRIGDATLYGPCKAGVLDMLTSLDTYYAEKFAHLVEQLDQINEGEGRLLDSSAVVWFQEMSDGCAHNLNNLPIIQAGGCGGYFKTGWTINVEDGSAELTTGNSEYYCSGDSEDMVDGLSQSTGTDPAVANAPINKYFCNLMNALGVKAGADGFPALGGAAEVTKYGKYDKTEDFIGGDVNPPTIHDPGEFSALRANT